LTLVTVAALAAATVTSGLLLRGDEVLPQGPLVQTGAPHGSGLLSEPGDPLTYGGIAVYNSGTEPAILERVVLVRPNKGMRLVGALAGPVPWGGFVLAFADFPPPEDYLPAWMVRPPTLHPLEGFVVPPQPRASEDTARMTKIYVGLESTEPEGSVALEAFEVRYRVGDRRYVLVVPQTVTICTPRAVWEGGDCPTFLTGDKNPSRDSR
jgi:hypothetical protein